MRNFTLFVIFSILHSVYSLRHLCLCHDVSTFRAIPFSNSEIFCFSIYILAHITSLRTCIELSTFTTSLSYQFALYSNSLTNSDYDTSAIDCASLWFFTIFLTCKSSKQIMSFLLIKNIHSEKQRLQNYIYRNSEHGINYNSFVS